MEIEKDKEKEDITVGNNISSSNKIMELSFSNSRQSYFNKNRSGSKMS